MRQDVEISHKVNRVLNLTILSFLLIFIRVWYLGVVQHDEHVKQATQPQRKTVLDKVHRATIRDRFDIPIASNKMQYCAAVRYAEIRQIPSGAWRKDLSGQKYREPLRNNYILKLANVLGDLLNMDPVEIEDTIHAKACLFPHTPFIIKDDLTEEEYYKLKLLEKDWIGIEAQRGAQRVYPMGRVGCDIVGYLGAISEQQYVKLAGEMKVLQDYLAQRDRGELALLPKGYSDPLQVRARLKELKEKAYTINDYVGKAGIELAFEETLRGLHGRKIFEVDPKGNPIRLMPNSKKGVSGQRLYLSISSELQEFAEGLLAHNEEVRHSREPSRRIGVARPWILGGAIVAMEPNSGDVLALASYPRFNPNDFVAGQKSKEKQQHIEKWLESENYIATLWDGINPLERERYDLSSANFSTEEKFLCWHMYLDTILAPDSSVKKSLENTLTTLSQALQMITAVDYLMQICETKDVMSIIEVLYSDPRFVRCKKTISLDERNLIEAKLFDHKDAVVSIKKVLDRHLNDITYNDDKLLLLDLCRLTVPLVAKENKAMQKWKDFPLSKMMELSQAMNKIRQPILASVRSLYHRRDFAQWRRDHFKEFIKIKRQEEKKEKRYVRPYTEYLEKIEKAMFKEFWERYHPQLIYSALGEENSLEVEKDPTLRCYIEEIRRLGRDNRSFTNLVRQLQISFKDISSYDTLEIIRGIKGFSEMKTPLWGRYRMLRNTNGVQQLKHLAAAFYPVTGFGYGRSQAYRQAAAHGSVFKLVVAYEAMREKYHFLLENNRSLSEINPLTLVDQLRFNNPGTNQQILGYTLEGQSIPRYFKGGRLPRSHPNIGTIDVTGALEQSSNLYFSYLAQEHIEDPSQLEIAAKNMGYGSRTGIDLPGEISGHIPTDLSDNKTGLYSFAIGQHSLIVTPLQASVMTSSIANGGKIIKPKIVQLTTGQKKSEDPFARIDHYPFQEQLALLGIDFPLFTEALPVEKKDEICWKDTEVLREIFLPDQIRNMLLSGMQKVLNGSKGTARPGVIRALYAHPKIYRDYMEMRNRIVGKTGTAETLYKQWIDAESKAEISNNIWFSGICFAQDEQGKVLWDKPELVISVYLRFSDTGGKEAAPLAAQIAVKWEEICKKYGKKSFYIRSNSEN